jgi:hypothetical protein
MEVLEIALLAQLMSDQKILLDLVCRNFGGLRYLAPFLELGFQKLGQGIGGRI